jgi:HK97 family phage portal protein
VTPIISTLTAPLVALGEATTSTFRNLTGGVRFGTSSWGLHVLLGRTKINYRAEVADPTRNSIVIAVVGWIARNFPEAPVQITRGAEVVSAGPTGAGRLLQLLERPNPYFSGVLLWMATVVDLFTSGNAYWLKVRSGAGGPTDRVLEYWWIPSRMLRPIWPTDGSTFISGYVYTVDGREYFIPKHNVFHLRDGIDPENQRLGLSKLASLFREIYTDDEAANFTAQLLTNLGVPGVVIAPSNTAPANVKSDPESVKQKFAETFGGDRRGQPLVLTSPTDVKVLSFNPEQMQLRELRKVPEERITAVFGVSAIVAGLGAGLDRSTFTNFGEARKAAYQESVIPLQRLIAAEIEVQLLPDWADTESTPHDVGFDTSKASALQEALDAVWKRNESAAKVGLLMRSEFKRSVGLEAAPTDDVYIIPGNYVILPAGATPPSPTAPAPAQPATIQPGTRTVRPGAGESTNGAHELQEAVHN